MKMISDKIAIDKVFRRRDRYDGGALQQRI